MNAYHQPENPCYSGPARLQVLLIPGNPGSAQYYRTQMQMLHQAMGGDIDVAAINHAGHDPKLNDADGGKVRIEESSNGTMADLLEQW